MKKTYIFDMVFCVILGLFVLLSIIWGISDGLNKAREEAQAIGDEHRALVVQAALDEIAAEELSLEVIQKETAKAQDKAQEIENPKPLYFRPVITSILGNALFGSFIGAIVAIVIASIVSEIFKPDPAYRPPDSPVAIFSLSDNITSRFSGSGAFVFAIGGFSGSEETGMTYGFYQRAVDGTYFFRTIQSDYDTKVRIKLTDDDVKPVAIRAQPDKRYQTQSWIAPFDITSDDRADEVWTLRVPRGTILNQLELDGQ